MTNKVAVHCPQTKNPNNPNEPQLSVSPEQPKCQEGPMTGLGPCEAIQPKCQEGPITSKDDVVPKKKRKIIS